MCWWRRRADSNRRIEVLQTSALTTWPRRLSRSWSGRRGSNSRPSPWEGDALPLSYFRMVPRRRFELLRACAHHPLKMACLPIPPPRLGASMSRISTGDLESHAISHRILTKINKHRQDSLDSNSFLFHSIHRQNTGTYVPGLLAAIPLFSSTSISSLDSPRRLPST